MKIVNFNVKDNEFNFNLYDDNSTKIANIVFQKEINHEYQVIFTITINKQNKQDLHQEIKYNIEKLREFISELKQIRFIDLDSTDFYESVDNKLYSDGQQYYYKIMGNAVLKEHAHTELMRYQYSNLKR